MSRKKGVCHPTIPVAVVMLLIGNLTRRKSCCKTKSVLVKRELNAITGRTLISSLITSTTDPVKKI